MVVLGQMICLRGTRLAELDLDGGVSDAEPLADPRLDLAHHALRVSQRLLLNHDVDAQREMFGRDGPDVKIVM